MKLSCRVNAKTEVLEVDALTPLIEVLRERLALIGAHQGCTGDNCGACTVLVNDVPVYACQVPACQVQGADVRTVEGLTSDPERLAPCRKRLPRPGPPPAASARQECS